jgi:Putative peptidoglycan binding domain
MRLMKGSLVGLVLGGMMALAPTAAFAHGGGGHFGGGGGHFGGGGSRFVGGGSRFVGGGGRFVGGGRFFGGGSHFVGGGGRFIGFTGHSFGGHSFAEHQGERFARDGDRFRDHFRDEDHFRLRDHFDGDFFIGDPFIVDSFAYDYPYYGFDYPDYGYYDNSAGDYYDAQSSPAEVTPSRHTIVAVQQLLYQLGYYDGPIDGVIGPQTAKAVRWFQSVDTLSVTGQIDSPTLKALGIS